MGQYMKNFLFIALFFVAFSSYILAEEYIENKIVVKFKKNSKFAAIWKENNRVAEFEEFKAILKDHIAKPYVPDNLLKAYKNAQNRKFRRDANIKDINLDLIAIIEYKGNINPLVASRKIATYTDVEYAEPLYRRQLFGSSNDSLFSTQYYIEKIKADLAWQYIDTNYTVLVGIVDTGIDYEHEDLKDNIFINNGEYGLDSEGREKQSNGIDDDNNGFVDDWIGWDFYGDGDNNPAPGNAHGTHVAGTIGAVANNGVGIAGIARNVKLLAVKIGPDISFATNIENGYQGILYAASMGADIINCSWGGSHYSQAEADIINAVNQLGSLVVAAAGNNNQYMLIYPAMYDGVLSVAAVDKDDKRAFFSNYHYSVDVSAPGVDIMAPIPGNEYRTMSGTSMASPIAAAVAALAKNRFKNKPNSIIGEIVKACSDNIDYLNPYYAGQIGVGRVNALRVMTDTSFISLRVLSLEIVGQNNLLRKEYFPGDTIRFNLTIKNILDNVRNVSVKIYTQNIELMKIINDSIFIGDLATNEIARTSIPFEFVVKNINQYDKEIRLVARVIADNYYSDNFSYDIIISPSYRTFESNNVKATFNSIGNIGYNDYPANRQGVGVCYKNSSSLAFEGALMLALNDNELYNVARGEYQLRKDNDFTMVSAIKKEIPGMVAETEGICNFATRNDDTLNISPIEIKQKVYQFGDKAPNSIFMIYTLYNKSDRDISQAYLGYYFDWDIGMPHNNVVWWDEENNVAFAKSSDSTYPMAAVVNLSQYGDNFFAIDNDGMDENNPGVYDGFRREEKLRFMRNGVQRKVSSKTDASMVISAGAFSIAKGDSVVIPFAIVLGENEKDIIAEVNSARNIANQILSSFNENNKNLSVYIYPNPVRDKINLNINSKDDTYMEINLFDNQGRELGILPKTYFIRKGMNNITLNLEKNIPSGTYFLKIESKDINESFKIVVVH